MKRTSKTKDAVEILDRRYGGDDEWDRIVAEEELKVRVSQIALDLRERSGLTQNELAQKVGATQSMISKLENADYDGSSLELLWRICLGLNRRLDISCSEGLPKSA